MALRPEWLALLVTAALTVDSSTAADPLPQLPELLKEYRALGLPFPPKDAKLVRYWCPGGGMLEDGKIVHPFECIAFEIKPGRKAQKPIITDGFHNVDDLVHRNWDLRPREIKPDRDALKGIHLESETALILAIQCQERGWDELGKLLHQRIPEYLELESKNYNDPKDQVKSMVKLLERLALKHHMGQLSHPTADRSESARHLRVLLARDQELDTEHFRALLKSLDLALVPSKAKPGSVEALIDKLVDYNTDTGTLGVFEAPGGAYRQLVAMGFDAVPGLIEHLNDERLTRAKMMGFNNFPTWNLRVGNLVGDLIEGLADEELMRGTDSKDVGVGDIRRLQGWSIKKSAVLQWWGNAQKLGEEKYLLTRILPKPAEDKRQLQLSDHLLQVIAAKYPKQLPVLYKTILEKRRDVYSWPLAEALLAGPTLANDKLELYLYAAQLEDTDHRLPAFHAIKHLDKKKFDALIYKAIQDMRKDVSTEYWSSPEPAFTRLAIQSDDPKIWEMLAKVIQRSSLGLRMELLKSISDAKEPRWRAERLRLLAEFLDDDAIRDTKSDKRYSGPNAAMMYETISVRDFVAIEISGMLCIEVTDNPMRTPEEWAKIRDQARIGLKRELEKKR